ncbi:MAG: acyl-ACP desaturase [Actinomycetota bacterium]
MTSVASLMDELTPVAERLTERHYDTCKPWYPHEHVPWSLGRDFVPGEAWDAAEVPLPDPVRSALFVNLLTEDNLPYYFQTIDATFGNAGVWREWSHRWTAEEARHSIALRDFMTVTRTLNPRDLEDGRMAQMSGGQVPQPTNPVDAFVYVALQELATRIAHRNTGKALTDALGDHPVAQAGYDVLGRVAADENFHFLFYRDLTSAALEIAPSIVLPAIERQVREFEMPGTGIPGFKQLAEAIARGGLYNLQQHHDQILQPVVVQWWKLESRQGLTSEAEVARDAVLDRVQRIGKAARRLADRAREAADRAKTVLAERRPGSLGS